MPSTITPFDTKEHHIYIPFSLTSPLRKTEELFGILDTGAPRTEFSDIALYQAGLIKKPDAIISIKSGLQTQKYAKIVLPSFEVLGHTIQNFEVMVSRFDKAWGISALIGLDFFKRFRVTIDYKAGHLVTDPL